MRTSHVKPGSRHRTAAAVAATAGVIVSAEAAVVVPSGKALGPAVRTGRANVLNVPNEIELPSGSATKVGTFPRFVGDIAIQVP